MRNHARGWRIQGVSRVQASEADHQDRGDGTPQDVDRDQDGRLPRGVQAPEVSATPSL